MTTDLSFVHLITNASFLVQIVMGLLLLASVFSWSVIYSKSRQLNSAKKEADSFEEIFWSGGDVSDIYKKLQPRRDELKGLERIFEAGLSEYARLHKQVRDPETVISGAQRAMRTTLARETDEIEANLSFLATVGSTSPYVGLFGTVWGIMNSFRALGNAQQATLAMVAPGIAEALIATAMGLFAAIPAVISYNRFANQVNRLMSSYDNFIEEFSTLLQRQVYTRQEKE